jgi:hypothetical protein
MDRQIWGQIRNAVIHADRTLPRVGRRTLYSDRLIVKLFLWSVWHDRPRCWATADRLHYNSLFRPNMLPSYSQFCRRLKSPRVLAMIQAVERRLVGTESGEQLGFFDGKPLPVSESSGDPEAKTGRGNGQFSRGYKLHAWATQAQKIKVFCVTAMNAGETTIAREALVGKLPPHTLTLADANYDSSPLYQAMADAGHRLLTPLKAAPKGRRSLRHASQARRAAIEQWERHPEECRRLLKQRGGIERTFANTGNFGGGLICLPPWVRGLERVTMWVRAKLIIYHAHQTARTLAA